MDPIANVLKGIQQRTAVNLEPTVPLGRTDCYVEWTPLDLIDPHEIAELLNLEVGLMSDPCYGKILDSRWHEFDTAEDSYSGWCYLVQQIDPNTAAEIHGKLWWIDEEDLTFTGALRRRVPDASQIEILNPTDERELMDFATTVPLWWRAKYGQ